MQIKKTGLALVTAALAALAFEAVSAQAQVWTPPDTVVPANASNSVLELQSGDIVQCQNAEIVIDTENDGGSPPGPTANGTIDSLTFGDPDPAAGCTSSIGDVDEITEVGFPWDGVATAVTGDPGDGTADVEFHQPVRSVTVEISALGGLVTCDLTVNGVDAVGNPLPVKAFWDASEDEFTVGNSIPPEGGGPDPNNVFVAVTGSALCPSSQFGTWSGTYAAGSPTPIEISGTVWSPPSTVVPASSTVSVLEGSAGPISCPDTDMVINTRDDGMGGPTANGTIDSLTHQVPLCTSPLGTVVNIIERGFPWPLEAIEEHPNGSGSGEAEITIPPGGGFTMFIELLGTLVTCELDVGAQGPIKAYWEDAAVDALTVGNHIPPVGGGSDLNNVFVTITGSALCPPSQFATWSGTYDALAPTPTEIND